MKLLLIADEEDPRLWDDPRPDALRDVDLILSAGDLKPEYLSYLVTVARCPLLYVHGNHDGRYAETPPEGCDCIDGKLVTVAGVRVLGLGGSYLYSGGPHQYTERQMKKRLRRLAFALRRKKGVDIVVSHAPVAGLGDMDNLTHRGFCCFRDLIEKYSPALWVHGHVHACYLPGLVRTRTLGSTTVVNAGRQTRYTLEV